MVSKQTRSQNADKPPVSAHPLFPALVALWFGALFGLGSLAIRHSLLESIVIATQIDTVFVSAAPPFGMTVKIILALVMAVFGAIVGGILARFIARPRVAKRARQRKAGPSRDLLASTAEEISTNGFGKNVARATQSAMAESAEPGRRRSLIVSEHSDADLGDSQYLSNSAPLPGGHPDIFDIAATDIADWKHPESETAMYENEPVPLDLTTFEISKPTMMNASVESPCTPDDFDQPEPALEEYSPIVAEQLYAVNISPDEEPAAHPVPIAFNLEIPEPQEHNSARHDESRRFDAPDISMSAPDAAITASIPVAYDPFSGEPQIETAEPEYALEEYEVTEIASTSHEEEPATAHFDEQELSEPEMPTPSAMRAFDRTEAVAAATASEEELPEMELNSQADSAAQRLADSELDTLSQAELLERLAMSIRQRKSAPSRAAVAAVMTADPVSAAPASVFIPEPAASLSLTIPAALMPINFSEYEDDDDHADILPQRAMTMPKQQTAKFEAVQPAFAALPEADLARNTAINGFEAEPDVAEDEYSSLLDISRLGQQRQHNVRIDVPEADDDAGIETVVVFPGQGAQAGSRFAAPAAPAIAHQQASEVHHLSVTSGLTAPQGNFAMPSESATKHNGAFLESGKEVAMQGIDPAETERALRSALASLQRMTGAS